MPAVERDLLSYSSSPTPRDGQWIPRSDWERLGANLPPALYGGTRLEDGGYRTLLLWQDRQDRRLWFPLNNGRRLPHAIAKDSAYIRPSFRAV